MHPGHLMAIPKDNLVQPSSLSVYLAEPNSVTTEEGWPLTFFSRHGGNLHHCLLTVLRFQWRVLGMAGGSLKSRRARRKGRLCKAPKQIIIKNKKNKHSSR